MIEKDKKVVVVTVAQQYKNREIFYKAELIPYFNEVSKERDPIMRPVENKGRFIHLSTMLDGVKKYTFKDESGNGFEPSQVMGILYGSE